MIINYDLSGASLSPPPRPSAPAAGRQQLYADGKFAELLAQVNACLPKDEAGSFIAEKEKSDVVHDLLGWLEGYVGAKVDDLTPKTKLQSYYEHDYDGFLAVLKKNRKKLAIDPARREPAEALKAEIEGSVGKLAPLRERIEGTDGLIDGCAAVRAHGRGDRHRGRQIDNEIEKAEIWEHAPANLKLPRVQACSALGAARPARGFHRVQKSPDHAFHSL